MSTRMVRRVALVAVLQLVLAGLALAPRLSAHAVGEEYRVRVAAFDPIDPFRGAYVALAYPDLRLVDDGEEDDRSEFPERGDVFVTLVRDGATWRSDGWTTTRPEDAPYLACTSDQGGWRLRCGIESWFADQDEAREVGERLTEDDGVATLRIDGRGHAALVDLETG